MRTRSAALLAFVAVLAIGCADGGRRIAQAPGERPTKSAPAMVRLVNHNWAMIAVYAVVQGQATRLGEVETGGTAVFNLPAGVSAVNDLQLRVELVGGRDTYETGQILVSPGQVIQMTIENHVALSSYTAEGT